MVLHGIANIERFVKLDLESWGVKSNGFVLSRNKANADRERREKKAFLASAFNKANRRSK